MQVINHQQQCANIHFIINLMFILIGCGWHDGVDGLKLLQVQVPTEVERGRSAVLGCRFEMEGDTLYSVKWYKGINKLTRSPHIYTADLFRLLGFKRVDLYRYCVT